VTHFDARESFSKQRSYTKQNFSRPNKTYIKLDLFESGRIPRYHCTLNSCFSCASASGNCATSCWYTYFKVWRLSAQYAWYPGTGTAAIFGTTMIRTRNHNCHCFFFFRFSISTVSDSVFQSQILIHTQPEDKHNQNFSTEPCINKNSLSRKDSPSPTNGNKFFFLSLFFPDLFLNIQCEKSESNHRISPNWIPEWTEQTETKIFNLILVCCRPAFLYRCRWAARGPVEDGAEVMGADWLAFVWVYRKPGCKLQCINTACACYTLSVWPKEFGCLSDCGRFPQSVGSDLTWSRVVTPVPTV
jgi:hypothetical protein